MLGLINIRWPEIADQQLIATQDIERWKAVMVVGAVKEAPLLAPVHRIVGGVEVEDQFLGGL